MIVSNEKAQEAYRLTREILGCDLQEDKSWAFFDPEWGWCYWCNGTHNTGHTWGCVVAKLYDLFYGHPLKETPLQGWWQPPGARKWHFANLEKSVNSLCNRWSLRHGEVLQADDDPFDAECKTCRRSLVRSRYYA